MATDCTIDSLKENSSCYQEFCMSQDGREAIELYAMVEELAAAGGTDYTADLNALLEAGKSYYPLGLVERQGAEAYIAVRNAIDAGATFDPSADAVYQAARQYLGIAKERRAALLLFMKCTLNSAGNP